MPETVALFNGCGGMSSLLVALAAALYPAALDAAGPVAVVSIVVSVFVGAITFTGSIVAMAKLQGWLSTPAWMQSKARHAVNIALAVASLVGAVEMLRNADSSTGLWLLVVADISRSGRSGCCLLYTSPSPRDLSTSRMPSSA